MILSMSSQALLFLGTLIMGMLSGVIYDIFRIIRKLFKHSGLIIQIEDVIYWILVSLLVFYYMLNENYGEVRGFSILGVFLGMLVYFFTFSKLFMSAADVVIEFLTKLFLATARILLAPIGILWKLMKQPVLICGKKAQKGAKTVRKLLLKFKNYARMKSRGLKKEMKIIFKHI